MATTATSTQTSNSNVKFMSVAQFKDAIGSSSLSILRSPITGKLFMATDGGQNYKVQQDINPKEEMKVLVEDDNIEQACLCNVKPGAETIFSL